MQKKNVVVSGLIASGKTTLCRLIEEQHVGSDKVNFVQEKFGECEHLPLFYQDPIKHILDVEEWFLDNRISNWRRVNSVLLDEEYRPSTPKVNLHDRCVYDSEVFAKANKAIGKFPTDKFLLYQTNFQEKVALLEKPDVILFLRVTPETCLKRIAERGREMEKSISLEYLQALSNAYEEYLEEMRTHCQVIVIPYDKFPPSTKTFIETELKHLFV